MYCAALFAALSVTATSWAWKHRFSTSWYSRWWMKWATAYPELAKAQPQVEPALEKEERRFAETLEQGMKILEEAIAGMSGDTIDGETVFKLYDTYGFPVDLDGRHCPRTQPQAG